MNPDTIEIHEFSTGIRPEKTTDGWVSRGFTGQYMNMTLESVPPAVERSIANREFAVTEGASSEKPAIIGRIVGSDEEIWSVVAVVTRGRDEIGRSLSVYRYFLCEGNNNLWKILAWLENQTMPNFNPFDTKSLGQPNLYIASTQSVQTQAREDSSLPLDTPEPMLLEPEHQYNVKEMNILAIKKAKYNQQPVSWAFNVEALEQPRRFQVIQAASQRAYEILDKAIKNAPLALRPVIGDEEALKSAIRGLINSSQAKPDAVQTISQALSNEQISKDYWNSLFDAQGAKTAINQKIYSPQMVRLITLRAMVIPETLPGFLRWLDIKGGKNKPDENQSVSLDFQSNIRDLFPKDKLADGVKFLLPKLLEKEITPEAIHWLLMVSGSAWFTCRKEFTDDVNSDLQLIADYFNPPQLSSSNSQTSLPSKPSQASFKCGNILRDLYQNWQKIRDNKDVLGYYKPLAELFNELESYKLSAYFYQVSEGVVPKDIYFFSKKINSDSDFAFGIKIYRKETIFENFYKILCVLKNNIKRKNIKIFIIFPLLITIIPLILKQSEVIDRLTAKPEVENKSDKPEQEGDIKKALQEFPETSKSIKKLVDELLKEYKKDKITEEKIQTIITDLLKDNSQEKKLNYKVLNSNNGEEFTLQDKEEWVKAIIKYQEGKKESGKIKIIDGIINIPNPSMQEDTKKNTTYEQLRLDIKEKIKNELSSNKSIKK